MKKLIVVGNGFDMAHGLQTTFNDFIKYSSNYSEKFSIFKTEKSCWNNVEDRFKEIVSDKLLEIGSEIAIDEEIERIIDEYGTDDSGEVNYYDYRSEAFKEDIEVISKIVLLLVGFEADFLHYLKDLYNDNSVKTKYRPQNILKSHFDTATKVINFNYTNVVELLYGFSDVEHIHGNLNTEIVIGCDMFERLNTSSIHADYPSSNISGRPKDVLVERMKYYEHDMDGNLVERAAIKRFFDDVVKRTRGNEEELYRWLKMRSKDLFENRKRLISSLLAEEFDEVHIIGHSLGKSDWGVINSIKSKRIICYFHDGDDFKRKKEYIEINRWNIELKTDEEIFSSNII